MPLWIARTVSLITAVTGAQVEAIATATGAAHPRAGPGRPAMALLARARFGRTELMIMIIMMIPASELTRTCFKLSGYSALLKF